MKNKIIGYIEIGLGLFFLISIGSDIQLGFGLVLLADGIKSI
jgi:hypothetical protein